MKGIGYEITVQHASLQPGERSDFDARLVGEIKVFWLRPQWQTRHAMTVGLKLLSPDGQQVLWRGDAHGQAERFIGMWNAKEFAEVIGNALDQALGQAIQEFASEEFQGLVKPSADP